MARKESCMRVWVPQMMLVVALLSMPVGYSCYPLPIASLVETHIPS